MSYSDKSARGKFYPMNAPRTHQNCIDVYEVARPGKTAVDKARGHIPYRKNRRVWDAEEEAWVKA